MSARKRARPKKEHTKSTKNRTKEEVAVKVVLPACAICFEDILELNAPSGHEKASLNGCVHLFHMFCIEKWSNVENTCPQCKARFTKLIQTPPPGPRTRTSHKKRRTIDVLPKNQPNADYYSVREYGLVSSSDEDDDDDDSEDEVHFALSLNRNLFMAMSRPEQLFQPISSLMPRQRVLLDISEDSESEDLDFGVGDSLSESEDSEATAEREAKQAPTQPPRRAVRMMAPPISWFSPTRDIHMRETLSSLRGSSSSGSSSSGSSSSGSSSSGSSSSGSSASGSSASGSPSSGTHSSGSPSSGSPSSETSSSGSSASGTPSSGSSASGSSVNGSSSRAIRPPGPSLRQVRRRPPGPRIPRNVARTAVPPSPTSRITQSAARQARALARSKLTASAGRVASRTRSRYSLTDKTTTDLCENDIR